MAYQASIMAYQASERLTVHQVYLSKHQLCLIKQKWLTKYQTRLTKFQLCLPRLSLCLTKHQTGAAVPAWIIQAKIDGFVAKDSLSIEFINICLPTGIAEAFVEAGINAVFITDPSFTTRIIVTTAFTHFAVEATPTRLALAFVPC